MRGAPPGATARDTVGGVAYGYPMRLLHTSDWHIGRTFHQHQTMEALGQVFDALIEAISTHRIDVVLASGDIFDSSTPSGEAVEMLDDVLLRIAGAGATVVLTSGNHDSPARLGAKAEFARAAGVHVTTRPEQIGLPVVLHDEHGAVHVYGIPFLEPARMRHRWSELPSVRSQQDVVGHAMDVVRQDLQTRGPGARSVVLAHTFVNGADGASCDSERDIVGGVDKVSVPTFDGVDYAALGHIHGRATLAPQVRYCGAPLHYSFSERDKPRGGWIVDLDQTGLAEVTWLDLPVPRMLSAIRGTLSELLEAPEHEAVRTHWISAVLTDPVRPMDAMRALQRRFPHCAHLEHRPDSVDATEGLSYATLVKGRTDAEVIDAFLQRVRNGQGASPAEAALVREVIGEYTAEELSS